MPGKDSKTAEPMRNIMKTGEWQDADAYRVACDCHHHAHDLDVWVEVEGDPEVKEITVTFYKELYSPVWEKGFNRFREALRLLFTGTSRVAGTIIMRREVAEDFLKVVRQSIDRLDQPK